MVGLIIAGERSGVGKTTVTLALLAALAQRTKGVQSFKVGPDYIDPMFHRHVTGRPCYNLDPVLTSEDYVQRCFADHSQGAKAVLVEGVMGLFDGAAGSHDFASTAHIARLINRPVLLVIDCSRLSRSVAAIAQGFRCLDPRISLAGVVLNQVGSDRHLALLRDALDPLRLPILGVLRREAAITLPDRHLGLVPTAELPQLQVHIDHLANLGKQCFDWKRLLPLLTPEPPAASLPSAPLLSSSFAHLSSNPSASQPPRIAVADDKAFSFYYPDNLEILKTVGAEVVPWSPLQDTALPSGTQGLYFGGGFPEMFAESLAANTPALQSVRQAVLRGLPTYAECGGLMYLSDRIVDFEARSWLMVGILPTAVTMAKHLTLGYRRAKALQASPLMSATQEVWGHEFHRSQVETPPKAPLYGLRRFDADQDFAREGWRVRRVHASYVHLHFGGCPTVAQRFVAACNASEAFDEGFS